MKGILAQHAPLDEERKHALQQVFREAPVRNIRKVVHVLGARAYPSSPHVWQTYIVYHR